MKRLFFVMGILGMFFANSALADSTAPGVISAITSMAYGGSPIGAIVAWNSSTMPSDGEWLECNGQTVSAANYPDYVARFGTTLPDYRGLFLRGYGSTSHTKWNGAYYGESETTHSSGGIGAIQGDAVRNVTAAGFRAMIAKGSQPTSLFDVSDAVFGDITAGIGKQYALSGSMSTNISWLAFNLGRMTPVAGEIRPVNKAVKYIIKVK